ADVRPVLAAIGRLEDVSGPRRGRRVEPVVARVRDPVIAAINGDRCDGSLRQAVLIKTLPRRVGGGNAVGADPQQAVEGSNVNGLTASNADGTERAGSGAVGSGARAPGG